MHKHTHQDILKNIWKILKTIWSKFFFTLYLTCILRLVNVSLRCSVRNFLHPCYIADWKKIWCWSIFELNTSNMTQHFEKKLTIFKLFQRSNIFWSASLVSIHCVHIYIFPDTSFRSDFQISLKHDKKKWNKIYV